VVVVVRDGQVLLKPMRWGLIPFWAKDESIGNRMINARAETVKEKPSFRTSFRRKRCLVVADSFYEWQRLPNSKLKQPMRILHRDEGAFAFAGLWDSWRQADGKELESFTIITGEPNEVIALPPDNPKSVFRQMVQVESRCGRTAPGPLYEHVAAL
jgi:putative SOS response-associated peptidase YedK